MSLSSKAKTPRRWLTEILYDWKYFWPLFGIPMLLAEIFLGIFIIEKVRYTKIDWDAYMEEVSGPTDRGIFRYSELKGETGPLVYPAGFVWIYAMFRFISGGDGSNIRVAQFLFLGIYVLTLALVLAVYYRASTPSAKITQRREEKAKLRNASEAQFSIAHASEASTSSSSYLPTYALISLCLSKRVHSVYVLRMFNDGVAMLLLYAALAMFVCFRSPLKWTVGCIFYSLAVSVKMNIFLFAPALFLMMLKDVGLRRAIACVACCAIVQLVVGAPFIATDPIDYLRCAFGGFGDLQHKWTVNWKFVPSEIFLSSHMALVLLLLHVGTLLAFAHWRWCEREGGLVRLLRRSFRSAITSPSSAPGATGKVDGRHIATCLLECNFIGVIFARSLHFQFYSWYWHALPLLLWTSASALPVVVKLLVLALLEYAWSYGLEPVEGTSTPLSSMALQLAHAVLFVGILLSPPVNSSRAERRGDKVRRKVQ